MHLSAKIVAQLNEKFADKLLANVKQYNISVLIEDYGMVEKM